MQDIDKRSFNRGMFMSSTLELSVFMGKDYLENLHSTLKQMVDISEKLVVGQSDEIFGVSPINWEDSSWKQLTLVNDEEVMSLSHAKVYVFSDSVLCLGEMNQNPTSNTVWERKLGWFKDSSQRQNFGHNRRRTNGIRVEYFPRIYHIAAHQQSPRGPKWATHHKSRDELSLCRCSMTSYGDLETTKRNVLLTPHLSLFAKKVFQQDVGHFSDLDQRQSGIPLTKKDQEENGIESLNWSWSNSEKADTQFSEQRVRCLEERSKANEVENYLYTSAPMRDTVENCFSHNHFCKSAQYLRSSLRFVWREK